MLAAVIILSILVVLLASALIFVLLKYVRKPKEKEEKKETPVENKAEVRIEPKKLEDLYSQEMVRAGNIGEKVVVQAFRELLRTEFGYLFTNVCFEYDYGLSNEIDAILLCQGGIFVIETKYMNGKICGKRELHDWNCFRKNPYAGPLEFYNPIEQNKNHIENLSSLFSGPVPKMTSLVIFPISDISAVPFPEVKSLDEAIKTVKAAIREKKYSQNFIVQIYHEIREISAQYGIPKAQHVKNIERLKEQNENLD